MSTADGFWAGRRVLVTGDTGFKGAWLTLLLRSLGAEVSGLALAPDPGGAYDRLGLAAAGRSHEGDIRDRTFVDSVLAARRPEVVFHLAAQALVRRSFADPAETFDVNVTGTAVLLAAAGAAETVRTVVVVTSDKVYANDGSGHRFVETDPLGGGDPYSASKAAAELVVASWRHSFTGDGAPTVVAARAGNVIGGGDRAEDRLVPDLFRAIEAGRPLVVRHPGSVRPWQFVLEPIAGYVAYAEEAWHHRATTPAALNFGPGPESVWTVSAVVDELLGRAGRGSWEHRPDPHGGPEAVVLSLDSSAASRALGWRPVLDLGTALAWTLAWWEAEQAGTDLGVLASAQVDHYREMMAP